MSIVKKTLVAIILLNLCATVFSAQARATKEEYQVYAGILRELNRRILEENRARHAFVILDETLVPKRVDEVEKSGMKGLVSDFKSKNAEASKLERLIPVKLKYQIVSKAEFDDLLGIGGRELEKIEAEHKARNERIGFGKGDIVWKPFFEKFPNSNGIYRFSRVGFSLNKKFALVYFERKSGSSGESMQYIMCKVKGRWRIYSGGGMGWDI